MNPKRVVGIILTVIVLLLLAAGFWLARSSGTSIAEAPRVPPAQPVAQPAAEQQSAPAVAVNPAAPAAPAARSTYALSSDTTDPVTTTQTFGLVAGWNAIYLEVEPINTSPLVNIAPPNEDPVMVHEKSTVETVFADLAARGVLESVWAWNTPTTQVDYIVDPSEGLWDAPGWKRYIPEGNTGPDGASRAFLTDLANLHANTAYLVKLGNLGGRAVALRVTGTPIVEDRHWAKGSYNLAGFPIAPGTMPTVDAFKGNAPITEVRTLTTAGNWSSPLAGTDTLAPGKAYLVFYDDQDPNAPDDYTAPLHIMDSVRDGLAFTRGAAGRQQKLSIENLTGIAASVDLSLGEETGAGVALWLTDPVTASLKAGPARITLAPHAAAVLRLTVPAGEQSGDGEALLQISSTELGTRWRLPVRAQPGSLAGLWVGEVTVNDVSEGRLGATNVEGGLLTIAMRPREGSGITGKAGLQEKISGNTSSVALTLTLALPASEIVTPTVRTGTGLTLRGYVFADRNQNGERDGAEAGFAGRTVTLTLSGVERTTTTGADGGYLFQNLDAGAYTLKLDQQPPTGYTGNFTVTPPRTETGQSTPAPNAWPESVTLGENGVTQVTYRTSTGQTISRTDFPRYDATWARVEPYLNFGYVSAYDATLWTGVCNDRREKRRDLGSVVNGVLVTEMARASLNPPRGSVDDELLTGPNSYVITVTGPGGAGVACGEIAVGAPTRFANGVGSDFTFRLILRVNEANEAAILPYYALDSGQRVSSANFSITKPLTDTYNHFGDTSALLDYLITIAAEDPLNPYKHKYQPDHDNLDAKFNPMNLDTVDPWLWESYEVKRRIKLELTELPPYNGATQDDAIELDWGGAVYGGQYQEVIKGIHLNDITVKGYFVIRQVFPWESLVRQPYDGTAGGG
jgi:hypothetical protein